PRAAQSPGRPQPERRPRPAVRLTSRSIREFRQETSSRPEIPGGEGSTAFGGPMNVQCRIPRGALTALLALALPAAVWGGQVRGKVLGPGDDPLPGVTLTLANDLTGYSQQAVSGADG